MLQPTLAVRSVPTRTHTRHQRQAVLQSLRGTVTNLLTDLRNLDARIDGMTQALPTPGTHFDALAEMASGLRCVRSDLLADAIETLEVLATADDAELRHRFEERQGWLAVEGE